MSKLTAYCTNEMCCKTFMRKNHPKYKQLIDRLDELMYQKKNTKHIWEKRAMAGEIKKLQREITTTTESFCRAGGVAKDVPLSAIDCPECRCVLFWKRELTTEEEKLNKKVLSKTSSQGKYI